MHHAIGLGLIVGSAFLYAFVSCAGSLKGPEPAQAVEVETQEVKE